MWIAANAGMTGSAGTGAGMWIAANAGMTGSAGTGAGMWIAANTGMTGSAGVADNANNAGSVAAAFAAQDRALAGVSGHWAERYVRYLNERGIFKGDDNGNANLESAVTRAEFAALLVRALYPDADMGTGADHFADVGAHSWYYAVVSFAYEMGLVQGDGAYFYPEDRVKREEIVLMLVRALSLSGGEASFTDVGTDYIYYDAIAAAVGAGLIAGFDDGSFQPKADATRAQAAVMIGRTLEYKGEVIPELPDGEAGEPGGSEGQPGEGGEQPGGSEGQPGEGGGQPGGSEGQPGEGGEQPGGSGDQPGLVPDQPGQGGAGEAEPDESPKKLNLTWQQVYSSAVRYTGAHMDGVGVIAPTWFELFRLEPGQVPAANETQLGSTDLYIRSFLNEDYLADAAMEGYEVWPLFRNDFSSRAVTSDFLASDEARWAAISLLEGLCARYGFGGINVDFENMNLTDKDAFSWFVYELSGMADRADVMLSVCVTRYSPYGGTWSLCYDRAAIGSYADYVMLMAYDETAAGSATAGSVSSLPWVEEGLRLLLEEVSAKKVVLGMPLYTRLWATDAAGQVTSSALGMDKVAQRVAAAGAVSRYDAATGQNYAEWNENGTRYQVWLEDEVSLAARIELVHRYNLAGMATWSKEFASEGIWPFMDELLQQ